MIKTTTTNVLQAQQEIKKALDEFMTKKFVTVGIHEDAGNHESDDITNAQLGAVHEYGAEIDHPGGTAFGYATEADAEKGAVRFLQTGQGFMQLGTTGPYKIKIPERPWLMPGVESGYDKYIRIIRNAVKRDQNLEKALNRVGVVAVSQVQQYMTELKTPANAPGTIAKKGSSNPLIDEGVLRQSVTYKIETKKPDEGLT